MLRRAARMMMAAVKALLHGVLVATVVPKAVKRRRGDARASLATAPHPARHRMGGGRPRRWQRREAKQGRSWWGLIQETYHDWLADKAPRLGAALAYYTVFSLAPILVIVLGVVGLVYGADAAQGEIHQHLAGFLGQDAAKGVEEMIAAARKPMSGTVAIVLGVGALLFGASGVFGQLKDAMNTIWEVEPKPGRGIWGTIKDRFLSFAMVLGVGFLLLVSLALSTALATMGRFAGSVIPLPEVVMHALNLAVSFGVITLLFAMIFKLLPDVDIAWSDVWVGAAATALLFTIGKYVFGLYLGQASVASSYGAAGSLIVVMLWAYYSAQILFFGAEFTQVYARAYGSRIRPAPGARPVTAESRAQQGI
ncbi:MAG: YihY/virulence factor BrkB family protein [Pirellulales bacterium]